MELDELKILLKEKLDTQHPEKSTEDISKLLSKHTQSVIGKLKRSLWIEIIACLVFTLACAAVGVFGKYASLQIYFSIFAILCFLFLPVLWFLLQKTKKLSNTSLPVKSNLEFLVKILKEYVKRYFQLTMALIPITIFIAFLLGYSDENLHNPELHNPFFPILTGSTLNIIFVIIYLLLFPVGMYYVTKWYLKKFYGNYINELQSLIKELEE
jgi:MFS family permease